MEKNEYPKMAAFEDTYWWHKGKKHLLDALLTMYLPQSENKLEILEIGCGTGGILKGLVKWGNTTGIDISQNAIKECKKKGIKSVIHADFNELALANFKNRFDVILALDVLEHVQDDIKALSKVKKFLKKDGYFFASVPAHKFLWSEHDEALHHKRRYHSLEITQKLKDTGFEITKKTYFVVAAFPVIALYRILGNFFRKTAYPHTSYIPLPKHLNDAMTFVLKLEASLIKRINFPIGTTIVVVAKNR